MSNGRASIYKHHKGPSSDVHNDSLDSIEGERNDSILPFTYTNAVLDHTRRERVWSLSPHFLGLYVKLGTKF